MKLTNRQDSDILDELSQLFDSETAGCQPTRDERAFIKAREKLEEEVGLDFDRFVDNYNRIQSYGLEQKLFQRLEWFIVFNLENGEASFKQTVFWKQFKNHAIVERAHQEYERKMELKR
jgi:hypothetical protein